MNYYELNMKLLKQNSKTIYQQVKNDISEQDINYVEANSKNEIVLVKDDSKVNMHSVYDTNFEMKKMFSELTGDEKVIIIFGLGEGHAIKYIKENCKTVEKIIVIEPDIDWFKIFITYNNLIDFVKGISISFILNKPAQFVGNEVGKYIYDTTTKVVFHLSYRIVYDQYYKKMMESLKTHVMMRAGNYSFRRNALDAVTVNFISNLKYGYWGSECIESIFKDKPLLVVAAGPSLNKNMHLIREMLDKAIIVAAGSAIKILDTHGITPHFRIAFDPFSAEKKVVENLTDENVPLLYSYNLYYEIAENYKGEKIVLDFGSDTGKLYLNRKKKQDRKVIQTASSIAVSAVDMGIKYGSSKIIIIGFDASFAPDKMYADGIGDRDKEIKSKLERPDIFEATDIYGNRVYTNKGFTMNKVGLEVILEANPQVNFINATEGGLPIKGSTNMTLETVIKEELMQSFNLRETLNLESESISLSKYKDEVKVDLKEMLSDIEDIEQINNRRIKLLKKLHKYFESSKKMNQISRELENMKSFETDLEDILFYKHYVRINLKSIFDAVNDSTRYYGFDLNEKNRVGLEKILKKSTELKIYSQFLKRVINAEIEGNLVEIISLT